MTPFFSKVIIVKHKLFNFPSKLHVRYIKFWISAYTLLVVSSVLMGCIQVQPVAVVQPEAQPSYQPFIKSAFLAQILSSITPIKIMITEYYNTRGKYPSSLLDLGLNRDKVSTAQYIDDLELDDRGNILILAGKELGENVYINLEHEELMDGLQIAWNCKTNIEKSALAHLQNCTYNNDIHNL